jgi:acyl carrier protein
LHQLETEIAELIIQAAGLEEIQATEIDPEAPLFVTGLGLDSIDALEIGLALHRRYGVTFPTDSHDVRRHFGSVRSLAAFVAAARTPTGDA